MDTTQKKQFHFLRDLVVFICILATLSVLLFLFVPNSFVSETPLIELPNGLVLFISGLFDLADGVVCTFIFSALLFHYFLWRADYSIILGVAIFFTGLLLTFNYILYFRTAGPHNEGFSWFIAHCYFTISFAVSLGAILYGDTQVRVYKTTYIVTICLILFILLIGAILHTVFIQFPVFFFFTDSFFLYYNIFEAIPFFIYLLICIPLQILFFVKDKRYLTYGLLFSSIPFLTGYIINLFTTNERYFENITLYGLFELTGFFSIGIGIFLDNFGIYAALKKNKENAELLTEAKNNFISNFSFHLRTPLNAVIGYVECLEEGLDGPLNEKQKGSISQIKKASNKLLKLIQEIIDISRIESGKISYNISQFSLNESCRKIVDILSSKAVAKGIELRIELPDYDIIAITDEARIKQVVFHLLDNGIKYTDKGSVVLRVEEFHDRIILSVSDTGKGISKELLPKIFEPYVHLDRENVQGSLGIGLSIVRLIANALNATVEVQSTIGEGSTFSFNLPKG